MYCTFFGLQWFRYDSTPPFSAGSPRCSRVFFHLQRLTQESHQCTVNIIFLRHRDEEKHEGGWARRVRLNLHLCRLLQKNQIHNLECIYCPFPTPLLFLFERGRTNRAWSLEHDVTHKQSDCQVTGEAAPLVLIIPVKPPPSPPLHLRLNWSPLCWRRKNFHRFTPSNSLSLSSGLGVFVSGDECQTGREASCSGHVGGFI